MGKHNPNQSLADILENIERAQRYIGTSSLSDFRSDEQKIDAVLRRLQNASEASTRFRNEWPEVAAEFETRHPEVNWMNFRNLLQVQLAVTAELPFSEPGEQTEIQ